MEHDVHTKIAEPSSCRASVEPCLRGSDRSGIRFQHGYHARAAMDIETSVAEVVDVRDAVCAMVGS